MSVLDNAKGKSVRVWDTEAFEGSVGTAGDAVAFSGTFPSQTGIYIKHADSAGTLYIGIGLQESDLSSTFPGIDLSPGQSAEIPCGAGQDIVVKASVGTIAYCVQRFSE